MKLSIRLQNHGKTNHPLWWIVIAPNRKNIRGRFIEHVGYWTPRHGVNAQRQIILNMPRIKHWIGCGAVPSFRVQTFLSHWNLMPKPWYYQKDPQELNKPKKLVEQMTDKQKKFHERRVKAKEREKLSPLNYHRQESKYMAEHTRIENRVRRRIFEKMGVTERQNQILRELLLHNEFEKYNRIAQLSGKATFSDSQQLAKLSQHLRKAKSELALIDKNYKNATTMQKIKVMQEVNELSKLIREAEKKKDPFKKSEPYDPLANSMQEYTTQQNLDKKIEYELITKKLQRLQEQIEQYQELSQPLTIEETAEYIHDMILLPFVKQVVDQHEDELKEQGEQQHEQQEKDEEDLQLKEQKSEKQLQEQEQQLDRKLEEQYQGGFEDQQREIEQINKTAHDNLEEQLYELKQHMNPKKLAYELSEALFTARGKKGTIDVTRRFILKIRVKIQKQFEKYFNRKQDEDEVQFQDLDEEGEQFSQNDSEDEGYKKNNSEQQFKKKFMHADSFIKELINSDNVVIPSNRPVHPFPDLDTYVPEEYYEPITHYDLQVVKHGSLEAFGQLEKYHQKKTKTGKIPK